MKLTYIVNVLLLCHSFSNTGHEAVATVLQPAEQIDTTSYRSYLTTSILRNTNRKFMVDLLWNGTLELAKINLNHENYRCLTTLIDYMEAVLQKQELWAIQMYDASSDVQPGFLTGNIQDMGAYDECIEIEHKTDNFTGQFCTVILNDTLSPMQSHISLKNIPVSYSLCIPSVCSPKIVTDVINLAAKNLFKNLSFTTKERDCFVKKDYPYSASDWFAITVFSLIIGLCVLATIYDIYWEHDNSDKRISALISFSLHTNCRLLLSVAKNNELMDCLYGLRFLIMVWIILIHRFTQLHVVPAMGMFQWNNIIQDWSRAFITNGFICVDTFLVMSGMLLSYTFLKKINRKREFNIGEFYLHRYVRLTPALAGIVLFYATLSDRLCDGPLCPLYDDTVKKPCVKNWWAALLYINNYYDSDNMCAVQTWYTSVDMQLFFMSPVLLYPLLHYPWIVPYLLSGLTTLSMLASIIQPYYNHIEAGYFILGKVEDHRIFLENYVYTHARATSWLLGFTLGIYMYKFKQSPKSIPKKILYVGWLLTGISFFGVIFSILPFQQESYQYHPVTDALYKSLHRLIWALASCWLMFACVNGYGGFLNKFLSWGPIFQPLGRLSYCIYLTHMLILKLQMGAQRTPVNFTDMTKVTVAFGDILGSVFSALILYLLFEAPGCALERIALGKANKKKTNKTTELELHDGNNK